MPFRAFGDSDFVFSRWEILGYAAFQCPFGHSGILTQGGHGYGIVAQSVSMPFRAFGDSDEDHGGAGKRVGRGFQCPFGHSGILTEGA